MPDLDSIDARIAIAIEARDTAALDNLLEELIKPAREAPSAFAPALEFRPRGRQVAAEQMEEGIDFRAGAVALANRISRAKRRINYEVKVLGGFDGLRIVSDGDSWFQYPLRLRDIIDVLSEDHDKAVLSLDGAGDELANMLREREYDEALAMTRAHALLFSAGGNDLLGEGRFVEVLKPFSPGAKAPDLINEDVLERRISDIVRDYRKIVADVGRRHPAVVMIGHGYDLPHPQRGGKWLGKPLDQRRIPLLIGREIVSIVVSRFNGALAQIAREFPFFRHVDLLGKVDRGASSWHDELHPVDAGYARAAEGFRQALSTLTVAHESMMAGRRPSVARPALYPAAAWLGEERVRAASREAPRATIVLDPGHGGSTNLLCSSANNAVGPVHGTLEKTLTLDVAKRAQRVIERRGVHACILTRSRDQNVAGAERADIAHRNGAAVFVSIHFNGSVGHNAQGTETFVHTRHDNTGASARLCRAVQAAVVGVTGLDDRNRRHPPHFIKKAGFCVINPATHAERTAAVLTEVSFMDRADEERRLLDDGYRDRIATAIVDGIEDYLTESAELALEEIAQGDVEIEDAVALQAHEAQITVSEMFETRRPLAARSAPHRHADWREAAARLIMPDFADAADQMSAVESGEFADMPIGAAPDFGAAAESESAALRLIDTLFSEVEAAAFDFAAFGRFIDGLGLRHFRAMEFLFLGAGNGTGNCAALNGLPPEGLWLNLAKTARMLDAIRDRLGAPVRILSCYRNEAYNQCIGGERNSWHTRFNAIDWTCTSGTPAKWREVAREVRRQNPDFAGGIGFYPRRRFIHIDTRGQDADW